MNDFGSKVSFIWSVADLEAIIAMPDQHFYEYTPPRPLEEIGKDIKALEHDIMKMLAEVTQ